MKKSASRFTSDFGTAARNVDETFEPTELQNPVPWPFIAIAVVLAVWSGVTLYLDAQATDQGEGAQRTRTAVEEGTAPAALTRAELQEAKGDRFAAQGAALFGTYCATCHQTNGSGVRGAIPPLDGSRYVVAEPEVSAAILLRGIGGPIEVKGVLYNGRMPTFHAVLNDDEIALILSHVRGAWSNEAGRVAPEQVAAVRQAHKSDLDRPWTDGFGLLQAFGIASDPAASEGKTAPSRPAGPDAGDSSREGAR